MLEGMLARSRDQLLSLDFLGPALLRMKKLIPINPNQERGYRITIDRLLQSFHRKKEYLQVPLKQLDRICLTDSLCK